MLSLTLVSLRRLCAGTFRGAADSNPWSLLRSARDRSSTPKADLIYRMKSWPELTDGARTAEIFRILSVMSSQPVNRQWLQARCSLLPEDLDKFLGHLVAQGALEVIDPANFAGREPARA
jgi:hypothetical protein